MKIGLFEFVLSIKQDQTPLGFLNMVVEHKINENRFSAASNPINTEDKRTNIRKISNREEKQET